MDARIAAIADALGAPGSRGAPAGAPLVRAGSAWGAAPALCIAALASRMRAPLLVIGMGPEEADTLAADLRAFLASDPAAAQAASSSRPSVLAFPAWESVPGRSHTPGHALFAARLAVLEALAEGRIGAGSIIVAPIAALLQPVPSLEHVRGLALRIAVGERKTPEAIGAVLSQSGLTRVPLVELPGEWAIRGGILDVYPLGAAEPLRIDFFGDEIEDVRVFDPETQRSLEPVAEARIPLAGANTLFRGPDALDATLADLMPKGTAVAVVEPARTEGMALELWRREGAEHALLAPPHVFDALARCPRLELAALPLPADEGDGTTLAIDLATRSVERASGADAAQVVRGVRFLVDGGVQVTVAAANAAARDRLREIFRDGGLADPTAADAASDAASLSAPARLDLDVGAISRGFEDAGGARAAALCTAHELFRRAPGALRDGAPAPRRRARPGHKGAPLESFLELSAGDLVVHVVHGIGRYLGIERLDGDDGIDHLAVLYANDVKVYVPATKIALVQRYVGLKGFKPRLSIVGGQTWQKTKERTQRAVMDLAASLLTVHAARDLEPGVPYPVDDHEQAAFVESFPFEDTPDQREAAIEIRADMAAPRPMDRLVCGDVGYGKTELAMRAAHCATRAGKQVAVLVPTTILAEQHLATFRDRMAPFGVRVACINRFRKGREVRAILAEVAAGETHILIGTHRLLSGDVHFKDLGLLVVDEEQRFGVAHKEVLKALRRTVDVLTMTATPIPRTLHMALLGIKDISALETAPEGRAPIRTQVAPARPELIREAILRELAREGQVFFVHNRVQSIERRADEIRRLVPEARVVVGHGQMHEELLEERMLAFLRHEVDVLVCTTIIESGLDIPRANTIFIDRADHFGLAELHQLRGRVGRSHHRAYAYMLTPPHGRVSTIGARRLKAIEEFAELGAGFKIAMRDLEIRGAGNLLGASQSGHICQVGYDLYCRLLAQAVDELRRRGQVDGVSLTRAAEAGVTREIAPTDRAAGGPAGPWAGALGEAAEQALLSGLGPGIEVELKLEARLPSRYIEDPRQRLEMYRKLAAAQSDAQLAAVEAELQDRFGRVPQPARVLIQLTRLRAYAESLQIQSVGVDAKMAVLSFTGPRARRLLEERLRAHRADARWPQPGVCYVLISRSPDPPPLEVLDALVACLAPS